MWEKVRVSKSHSFSDRNGHLKGQSRLSITSVIKQLMKKFLNACIRTSHTETYLKIYQSRGLKKSLEMVTFMYALNATS